MEETALQQLQRRTVRVLTAGQVLGGFGLGSTLSIGALLAEHLSGSAAWSGAAATFSTLGAATWAIPLSRLANKKGRRVSLATGAALAISGALLVITAAKFEIFPLLLVALFLMGAASAAGLQARFAAVDLPSSRSKGRDLSMVVWATTVGAVIGPNLFGPGQVVGLWLGLPALAGPFVFTILAQISSSTVFWFGLRPDPLLTAKARLSVKEKQHRISLKTAFATLKAHPAASYAVASIALSHMVMVSVMSMTPVHMESHHASLVLVGFTISLHIAGMYAFSPLFGMLVDRIGPMPSVLIGQVLNISALAFAGFGANSRTTVAIGLFLLGLGWSASTVSGSALLTASLPADEKANVQGLSDSMMNLSGAFGGAVAGTILKTFTFSGVTAAALLPVFFVLLYSGLHRLRNRRTAL